MLADTTSPTLSVFKSDPEARLGVSVGFGTAVNTWFAGIVGFILAVTFYTVVFFLPDVSFKSTMMERGPTQYACVFIAFWSLAILEIKRRKLKVQRQAIATSIIPDDGEFILSSQTAPELIRSIYTKCEDPERFIVFNRILIAVSNLQNLGRVSDVDDILRSVGERDESSHDSSFAILGGFLWSVPVLGFIGTVLGLAQAIGNFSELLNNDSDLSNVIGSLKDVTSGLSTAFETTLVALVIALVLQLWVTSQRKAEEVFLDDCSEYCLRNVVNRIKILPFEQTREV